MRRPATSSHLRYIVATPSRPVQEEQRTTENNRKEKANEEGFLDNEDFDDAMDDVKHRNSYRVKYPSHFVPDEEFICEFFSRTEHDEEKKLK